MYLFGVNVFTTQLSHPNARILSKTNIVFCLHFFNLFKRPIAAGDTMPNDTIGAYSKVASSSRIDRM
jgi:hypothetical protein